MIMFVLNVHNVRILTYSKQQQSSLASSGNPSSPRWNETGYLWSICWQQACRPHKYWLGGVVPHRVGADELAIPIEERV